MSSVDDTSIDQNELEKRRIEIKMQIKDLVDELETIESKLNENFAKKNQFLSESNNNSQQNNSTFYKYCSSSINNNSNNKSKYEGMENEINNSANNLDNTPKENSIFYDINLTQFDKLKEFFEQTWEVGFIQDYEITKTNGPFSDREIAAFKKMRFFINGSYIDDYEDKINAASLKQEDYNLPPDQLKARIENLLNTMIVRSKVLELYDKCGIEAGKLYDNFSKISRVQIYSYNAQNLTHVIYSLFDNKKYITWSFEKLKALFELWQAIIIGRCFGESFIEKSDDFYEDNRVFLNLLKTKELELTQQESEILISILKEAHDFGNK